MNIVAFLGITINPLCIISEYMPLGSLQSYIRNRSNVIDPTHLQKFAHGIAAGNKDK